MTGARGLAKRVCGRCVTCRKASTRVEQQVMGQLPGARTTPAHPFETTGVDFAGPFTLKLGRTRRPVLVKGYLAIYVCFVTKAVHLEPVSEMTTAAFLASLRRFVARRGLPRDLHTDNGSNFLGAKHALQELYDFMELPDVHSTINDYLLSLRITWHTIPERAPHFGGLWEAAVRSAKYHLKRIVGEQKLNFEEFSTVSAQVESYLNSKPLGTVNGHSPEGLTCLTPSHILLGRAGETYPETEVGVSIPLCRRWNLCQALTQQFWKRWATEYLQQLQSSNKWHKTLPNLQPGDLVTMTDGNHFHAHWTMGKVVKTYPDKDSLVRAVDIQVETIIPPSSPATPTPVDKLKTRTTIFRRPITKLALLLPVSAVPD